MIADFIRAALYDDQQSNLLHLSGEEAQIALDEMWNLLETISVQDTKAKLRRLCLKLAISSNCLPSALVLIGVQHTENHSRAVGGFADVYYGCVGGAMVAIKRLRMYTAATETQKLKLKQDFCREAILWTNLSHPHILPFLGVSEDAFPESMCMVLPWMEKGSVRVYMDSLHREGLIPGQQHLILVHQWLYEVALGLAYLHAEGIVHGDLHPGNMLVDDSDHIRLTDFGMSLIADATSYNYASIHGGGATRFKAPELIDPDVFEMTSTRPTYPSDIYSFGCVCIELYCGKVPFADLPDRVVALRVVRGLRPERPTSLNGDHMSDLMWSLTTSCWNETSTQRPTATTIFNSMKSVKTLEYSRKALVGASQEDVCSELVTDQNRVLEEIPRPTSTVVSEHVSVAQPGDWASVNGFRSFPQAQALASYHASLDDPFEVSLTQGEIVYVSVSGKPWWQVYKQDGSYGIAPSNHLAMLNEAVETQTAEAEDNDDTTSDISDLDISELPVQAKAVYPYMAAANNPGEVSLTLGELVEVYEISGDWYKVRRSNGEVGAVPSAWLANPKQKPHRPRAGKQRVSTRIHPFTGSLTHPETEMSRMPLTWDTWNMVEPETSSGWRPTSFIRKVRSVFKRN